MAERICKLNGKNIKFPDDCKNCGYLKPRGKISCCAYKGGTKKSCCK